jgi:hypothetical protein
MVFRRADDVMTIWEMDGGAVKSGATFIGPPSDWQIQNVAALYGPDANADLTWRDSSTA